MLREALKKPPPAERLFEEEGLDATSVVDEMKAFNVPPDGSNVAYTPNVSSYTPEAAL